MKNIGRRGGADADAEPRTSNIARKKQRGGGSRRQGLQQSKTYRGLQTWSGQVPRKKRKSCANDDHAPHVKVIRDRAKGGRGRFVPSLVDETEKGLGSHSNTSDENSKRRRRNRALPRSVAISVPLSDILRASTKNTVCCEEKAPPAITGPSVEDTWVVVESSTKVASSARVARSWKGDRKSRHSLVGGESKCESMDESEGACIIC